MVVLEHMCGHLLLHFMNITLTGIVYVLVLTHTTIHHQQYLRLWDKTTSVTQAVRIATSSYSMPLWDGAGCGQFNTCCTFNSPPWFLKEMSPSTNDGIEMRLCADQTRNNEDITFETLELYVQ